MDYSRSSSSSALLTPIRISKMNLRNRFVVPGLCRYRADPVTCCPTAVMGLYYGQKYHNGLIISEPIQVNSDYIPVPGTPGLFSDEHINPWQEIVDRVHMKSSNMVAQLYHPGRVASDNCLIPNVHAKAPSSIKIKGLNKFAKNLQFTEPESLTIEGIKQIIAQFKAAAIRARQAGFDCVEIEAGSGFLIDTFLRDSSNKRTDEYGGSIPNRCRLLFEIIDELSSIKGSDWIAVKISPMNSQYDMTDSNVPALLQYLLSELSTRGLAFLEVRKNGYLDILPTGPVFLKQLSQDITQPLEDLHPQLFKEVRALYVGNLIANADFPSIEYAGELIAKDNYQCCAFDALSIINPDIPQRLLQRGNINYNLISHSIYSGNRHGYTDYPFYIAHSKL